MAGQACYSQEVQSWEGARRRGSLLRFISLCHFREEQPPLPLCPCHLTPTFPRAHHRQLWQTHSTGCGAHCLVHLPPQSPSCPFKVSLSPVSCSLGPPFFPLSMGPLNAPNHSLAVWTGRGVCRGGSEASLRNNHQGRIGFISTPGPSVLH